MMQKRRWNIDHDSNALPFFCILNLFPLLTVWHEVCTRHRAHFHVGVCLFFFISFPICRLVFSLICNWILFSLHAHWNGVILNHVFAHCESIQVLAFSFIRIYFCVLWLNSIIVVYIYMNSIAMIYYAYNAMRSSFHLCLGKALRYLNIVRFS